MWTTLVWRSPTLKNHDFLQCEKHRCFTVHSSSGELPTWLQCYTGHTGDICYWLRCLDTYWAFTHGWEISRIMQLNLLCKTSFMRFDISGTKPNALPFLASICVRNWKAHVIKDKWLIRDMLHCKSSGHTGSHPDRKAISRAGYNCAHGGNEVRFKSSLRINFYNFLGTVLFSF